MVKILSLAFACFAGIGVLPTLADAVGVQSGQLDCTKTVVNPFEVEVARITGSQHLFEGRSIECELGVKLSEARLDSLDALSVEFEVIAADDLKKWRFLPQEERAARRVGFPPVVDEIRLSAGEFERTPFRRAATSTVTVELPEGASGNKQEHWLGIVPWVCDERSDASGGDSSDERASCVSVGRGHVLVGQPDSTAEHLHLMSMEARDATAAGRHAEAGSILDAALRMAPSSTLLWRQLAEAREAAGDRAGALQARRAALRNATNGRDVLNGVKVLYPGIWARTVASLRDSLDGVEEP